MSDRQTDLSLIGKFPPAERERLRAIGAHSQQSQESMLLVCQNIAWLDERGAINSKGGVVKVVRTIYGWDHSTVSMYRSIGVELVGTDANPKLGVKAIIESGVKDKRVLYDAVRLMRERKIGPAEALALVKGLGRDEATALRKGDVDAATGNPLVQIKFGTVTGRLDSAVVRRVEGAAERYRAEFGLNSPTQVLERWANLFDRAPRPLLEALDHLAQGEVAPITQALASLVTDEPLAGRDDSERRRVAREIVDALCDYLDLPRPIEPGLPRLELMA